MQLWDLENASSQWAQPNQFNPINNSSFIWNTIAWLWCIRRGISVFLWQLGWATRWSHFQGLAGHHHETQGEIFSRATKSSKPATVPANTLRRCKLDAHRQPQQDQRSSQGQGVLGSTLGPGCVWESGCTADFAPGIVGKQCEFSVISPYFPHWKGKCGKKGKKWLGKFKYFVKQHFHVHAKPWVTWKGNNDAHSRWWGFEWGFSNLIMHANED